MGKKRSILKSYSLSSSVMQYIKQHHAYKSFNTKEFLQVLDCPSPLIAKTEARERLQRILELKNVDQDVKAFASKPLTGDLNILSDANAQSYWLEKQNANSVIINSHKQFQVYV